MHDDLYEQVDKFIDTQSQRTHLFPYVLLIAGEWILSYFACLPSGNQFSLIFFPNKWKMLIDNLAMSYAKTFRGAKCIECSGLLERAQKYPHRSSTHTFSLGCCFFVTCGVFTVKWLPFFVGKVGPLW